MIRIDESSIRGPGLDDAGRNICGVFAQSRVHEGSQTLLRCGKNFAVRLFSSATRPAVK